MTVSSGKWKGQGDRKDGGELDGQAEKCTHRAPASPRRGVGIDKHESCHKFLRSECRTSNVESGFHYKFDDGRSMFNFRVNCHRAFASTARLRCRKKYGRSAPAA
jgi:hypothetical protein